MFGGALGCRARTPGGAAGEREDRGRVVLPQLRIHSSVLRTGPVANGPCVAIGNGEFDQRPRLDGGYTIARRGRAAVQVTPDAFRLLRLFLPGMRRSPCEIALTLDRWAWSGFLRPRHRTADTIPPFERFRVLDPEPQHRKLRKAMQTVHRVFPAFDDARITKGWGGIIDVTPDTMPIIDKVGEWPGLVLATGFSDHGIGPAVGQLATELATGAPPLVDPAPFRLLRFPASVSQQAPILHLQQSDGRRCHTGWHARSPAFMNPENFLYRPTIRFNWTSTGRNRFTLPERNDKTAGVQT